MEVWEDGMCIVGVGLPVSLHLGFSPIYYKPKKSQVNINVSFFPLALT